MQNAQNHSPLLKRYLNNIPITLVDPVERAAFASRSLEFKAVNTAILPENQESRSGFLDDLAGFIRTGRPDHFVVAEENLGEYYLVVIGGDHRISRKVYATHPLLPGKLLVIGGVGIVRPDAPNHCLTLQTPVYGMTLHGLFPDLASTAMSAGFPTPRKTVASTPNVDPVGGYSIRVAESKYRNVEMIAAGNKGIDPVKFPVISNVAWGTVGKNMAFYVYAVPDTAILVCEMLHATNRVEITDALARYLHAGKLLVQALRHLHDVGYVFNQPHQGNVYCYQNEKGQDQILIADLDTLQSIRDFSAKVPEGKYLSPKAFATLVNIQVASTHIAHIAWLDFVVALLKKLGLVDFPGLDRMYASIIVDLLCAYINIQDDKQKAEINTSIRNYFHELGRQSTGEMSETMGVVRLQQGDLYETDVFGFMFTHILMNAEYCTKFGARLLTSEINDSDLEQRARATMCDITTKSSLRAVTRVMNQAMSQLIEERSSQAMQEYIKAYFSDKKTR